MKKKTLIVVIAIFGFASQGIFAEEMKFPKSEAEFVDALSIKKPAGLPANTRGLTRGLDKRGLGGITEPSTPVKAGALINFDYDSDIIKPESYNLLDSFGNALKGGLSDAVIIVAGHTDSSGTDEYNNMLSVRRAKAVADYLIDRHHISEDRLVVQGYGEYMPIADNQTLNGRSLNRRVEFIRE